MALRIAIFGQAPFGRDVAARLADAGHAVVYTHVPPDRPGRVDPLAAEATERGWPLVRHKAFRRKGEPISERVEEFLAARAELIIMPFTTVILPPEIVEAPRLGALCFHPSLLPAYRGGNALAWQIILGAEESGVTVFQPDAGVDTGPIVVQRGGVRIGPTDTQASLYFDHLYPLGVEAMEEAVARVADGTAEPRPQPEAGASFQGLVDDEVARIDWSQPGEVVDRLVRGCDPQPGAWAEWSGEPVRLYGSAYEPGAAGEEPPGTVLALDGDPPRLRIATAGGGALRVEKLRVGKAKKVTAPEALADGALEPGARLG